MHGATTKTEFRISMGSSRMVDGFRRFER